METWIIISIILLLILLFVVHQNQQMEKFGEKYKEMGGVSTASVGKYIAGLSEYTLSSDNVNCVINEKDFVFFDLILNKELGRIPRDSINQIIVDNKSQIAQRLTVTRMLTLGVFSLAAPKKKVYEEFCLVIDWDDNKGIRHNTVFEFSDNASANLAANALNKYSLPKTEKLKSDEKKCPVCAEIIKKEAKMCRFCRSEL